VGDVLIQTGTIHLLLFITSTLLCSLLWTRRPTYPPTWLIYRNCSERFVPYPIIYDTFYPFCAVSYFRFFLNEVIYVKSDQYMVCLEAVKF